MKVSAFLALFLSSIASCTQPGVQSSTAGGNISAAKNIREAITSKDLSNLDKYIAADCIEHSGEKGDIHGLDSIRMQFRAWMAMTDEKSEILKELADEDYVMTWERTTGTYKTTGYGHRPGDKFDLQQVDVIRFKDGKAVEHWNMMPPGDVMKMMATTAAPATMDNAVIHQDSVRLKLKK